MPSKREMAYCAKNPWRCPSCGVRFPTKGKFKGHLNEIKTCVDNYYDGLIAVKKSVSSPSGPSWIKEWEAQLPINVMRKRL